MQLNLLDNLDEEKLAELSEQWEKYLKYPIKRIRYHRPNYLNFYTLYQYDRNKFRDMLRKWLKTDEAEREKAKSLESWLICLKKKQDEILEECYIRDEKGKILKDSDEKHIYRYKTLHYIQREIYDKIHWEFINNHSIFIIDDINLSYDEKTAEIKGTEWKMPIRQRVIIHIRLLRLLREGFKIKHAIKIMKKGDLWLSSTTKETTENTMTETKN